MHVNTRATERGVCEVTVVDEGFTLFGNSQAVFSHIGRVIWGIKLEEGRKGGREEGRRGGGEEGRRGGGEEGRRGGGEEGRKGGEKEGGEKERRRGGGQEVMEGEKRGREEEGRKRRNDINTAKILHSPNKQFTKKLPPSSQRH